MVHFRFQLSVSSFEMDGDFADTLHTVIVKVLLFVLVFMKMKLSEDLKAVQCL